MAKRFEIRCPVHGFIKLNEWEMDIVSHPVFQRLRRIRQLAWTDMVYPGAMHTRFEHSLGVMHTATMMFDDICARRSAELEAMRLTAPGRERDRIIVRLAGLLHDVGHAPFSHAGEELFPIIEGTKRYKHENYSSALIRELMTDVIDDHVSNDVDVKASEIADLIDGRPGLKQRLLFWRQLISSQLDADRADYLLRDSHHIGVQYGRYDLNRLIVSMTAAEDPETSGPVIAVEDGGIHAAEALILARYMMFTQVYYHKTRVAYDKHIFETLKQLLQDARGAPTFPAPTTPENLREYLDWTDWKVQGLLQAGNGGEHGRALRERDQYRVVFETPEVASESELVLAGELEQALEPLGVYVAPANSSWYKMQSSEIRILHRTSNEPVLVPLSEMSMVVKGLKALNQRRLYVPPANRVEALGIVREHQRRFNERELN